MRLRAHVILSSGTAAAVGALEAIGRDVAGREHVGLLWSLILGFGLVGLAGILFGLLQGVAWRAFVHATRRFALASWWSVATDRTHPERGAAVALHTFVVAGLATVATAALAYWFLLPPLLARQGDSRSTAVALPLLFVLAVLAFLLGLVLHRSLPRAVARLDAVVPLPWPSNVLLWHVLWVVSPVVLFLVPYLVRRSGMLGPYAVPFWIAAFLVVQRALLLALRPSARRWPRATTWLGRGLLLAIALAAGVSAYATSRRGPVVARTQGFDLVSSAAEVLRRATDIDQDGFSGMFGGLDCDSLDPDINPGVRDLPGNGVDENCDEEDAEPMEEPPLRTFSGALTHSAGARHDVILVVIDAVRADHTGLGGYTRPTTPYIDALGREALVFTQAFSQSSATMMSLPSLLAGKDPSTMTWEPAKRLAPARTETMLAARLAKLGYRTGLIGDHYVDEFLSRIQEDYEWHIDACPPRKTPAVWRSGCAGPAITEAIRFIERADEAPYFLTIYIEDPHAGYATHGFGLSRFGRDPVDRYDGELAHVDRHIGFLVAYLKATGRWDKTVLVITSDHGEEFSEHEGSHHARTCYVESTHVPLIVRAPGQPAAQIDQTVALIDIAPTILELIDTGDDSDSLEGQSLLVPLLAPHLSPRDRILPCAIISQRISQGNFFRRSVRTERWTLVHEVLHDRFELYDRASDPAEQSDVFGEARRRPEVRRLRAYLNDSLRGNLRGQLITD